MQQPSAPQLQPGGDGDPDKYTPGTEVNIGSYRFRCSGVLGRGSFSEVWAGEVLKGMERKEVALKDISCQSKTDLQQALLEASLLERFQNLATPPSSPGGSQAQPVMRIPQYLAHRVDRRRGGYRVRMAMTRVPGEALDSYLRRPPPPGQDGPSSVRRGAALAAQLIRQLGPTLERIAPHAWHRDVNSHNILMSDGIEGGKPHIVGDLEETTRRASFWLIDFGLAVDSNTWPVVWPHSDVAGDCRYWPPSSFMMSFYGPDEMSAHQDLCNQYKTRLDIVGLGLTALEILCATALASSHTWGPEGLRGSWRRLFTGWQKYRDEVTRWHTMIFQVFASGGDIGPLYQQLSREHVVDKVTAHIAKVRSLLRACTQRTEDIGIQRLLAVIADMIDERSTMGLREAVEALGPDPSQVRVAAHMPVPQAASYQPPPQVVMAQVPSYTPPQVMVSQPPSYVPPPQVAVSQAPSYTPPPVASLVAVPQAASYTPPPPVAIPQPASYTPPPQAVVHTGICQAASYTPPQVITCAGTPQAASYTPPAVQAPPLAQTVPRVLAAPAPVRCAVEAVQLADLDPKEVMSSQFQWHPPVVASQRPMRLHQWQQELIAPGAGITKGAPHLGYAMPARHQLAGA